MNKKTIEGVWEVFYKENQKTTIDAMNKDGWKTLQQVADMCGLSRSHVNQLANSGKMQTIKKKIYHSGRTRDVVFVRPIII